MSLSSSRRLWTLMLPNLVVVAVVLAVEPVADVRLAETTSFLPVMLALVGCFDVLSAVLLVGQFRDTGEPRALVLSWAYLSSLVLLVGWVAAFPGVFGTPGPLGDVPSTAPWLWIIWHTTFPVLVGLAMVPGLRWADRVVPVGRRRRLAWTTVPASAGAALMVVAAVVAFAEHLPVVIQGTDISDMTRIAGPVMLPIVALATVLAIVGAWRRGGSEKWAGLAATASLGDVVLTLLSHHRFSVGWYAGRTLTIVSAGVVLVALLWEFGSMKRRLAVDEGRLRAALDRRDRLERLQQTLLGHMTDGVVMQGRTGEIVASNPAAHSLLGLTVEEMWGRTPFDPRWRALRADGTPWGTAETPSMTAVRTGTGQRQDVMGLKAANGSIRWVSVNTAAVTAPSGAVEFVVSSMNDVTERHAAALAATQELDARRNRIQQVLDQGGPDIVFQPIVELATGRIVGAEALARFPLPPHRSPDQWFADAAEIGLGVALELSAIRRALTELDRLPQGVYMSLNAGPETAASPRLHELLSAAVPGRVILELTEHVGVEDYTDLAEALGRIRGLGVQLAVDDTGAGFSSLQHILNLRPDLIKLDRGLTTGIDADPARRALAGSLMTFAYDIGARVVAEGIENSREQTVLRRLGVRYGQGYHLGRPQPLPLPEKTGGRAVPCFADDLS